jgi:pyrimidine operon attenuation protein / uracil phosphoribosyltransferase
MDAEAVASAIARMAGGIAADYPGRGDLVIAGIPTRGVEVARRLIAELGGESGPELGVVDVSMHRDDLATRRRLTAVEATRLPVDLDGRDVILVDDVLFTGRSCRAALDAISSFGRPARIRLAVLVDRGHRELPIQPEYVGGRVETMRNEKIRVRFASIDHVPDSVHVVTPAA